jgi:hypothetical protein
VVAETILLSALTNNPSLQTMTQHVYTFRNVTVHVGRTKAGARINGTNKTEQSYLKYKINKP